MARSAGTLKTCSQGHRYRKSSDCPTCPVCEAERAPKEGFLSQIAAPARRALEHEGIDTLSKLADCEILRLHGMGPSTIPKLRSSLQDAGLTFKAKS